MPIVDNRQSRYSKNSDPPLSAGLDGAGDPSHEAAVRGINLRMIPRWETFDNHEPRAGHDHEGRMENRLAIFGVEYLTTFQLEIFAI